jgi:hypothetical protein
MRKRYALVTSAAIAIGGLLVPQVLAQDDPTKGPAERTGQAIDRAGERVGDAIDRGTSGTVAAPDAEGIRDVIAQIAEASVTKDGLDDLVERFVDADRNRLGKSELDNNEKLNGIIDQFRKNWKAKYNQDFDIGDEDAVFTNQFAMIMQGEIGEGARVAGERLPGDTTTPPGAPADPTVRDRPADAPGVGDRDRVAGGDTNRDPGRNVATVMIKESHGLPAVNLAMIHEMPDSWRLDLPDTVSAEQLRGNLENALTKLNEKQAQWPSDVNEAYRHATHCIVLAVQGKDPTKLGDDMSKPGTGMGTGMDRPNQPAAPR